MSRIERGARCHLASLPPGRASGHNARPALDLSGPLNRVHCPTVNVAHFLSLQFPKVAELCVGHRPPIHRLVAPRADAYGVTFAI